MSTQYTLPQIASQVRRDIVRMVTKAASGHPGGSMSSTDIMTWLFFKEMNVTPETWKRSGENLDMFFLSAGHMTPVLYSVMARRGYFPVDELNTFRLFGTRLQGHPCIEMSFPPASGPLIPRQSWKSSSLPMRMSASEHISENMAPSSSSRPFQKEAR